MFAIWNLSLEPDGNRKNQETEILRSGKQHNREVLEVKKAYGPILLVVVVSAILYSPILGNYFLNDDFGRILELRPLQEESILEAISILFSRAFNSYYRPFTYVSFYLLYKLATLSPFYYYLSSVILHMLASIAFFFVARCLSERRERPIGWIAVLATLVFIVHPRHVESVSYIHDNENVICGFFFFLSVMWYVKHCQSGRMLFLLLSCVGYLCSLLGKEMGVSLPLICLSYYFLFAREGNLKALSKDRLLVRSILSFAITFVFYMALRYNSLGTLVGGRGATSQLDFSISTIARTLFQAMLAMFLPNDFPGMDMAADFFRAHTMLFNFLGLAFLGGLTAWLLKGSRSKTFWFGMVWALCSLIPILNNGIGVAGLTGGRYLYIPLAGFSLCAAEFLLRIPRKALRVLISGLLIVVLSGFTYQNNVKLRRISEISEKFLKGFGNIISKDIAENERYAILVPSMYRGMYMLQSSLYAGLFLLHGERGRNFLRDKASLIMGLYIDETEGLNLETTKGDDGTVIAILGDGGSFFGKEELYNKEMIMKTQLSFGARKLINTRGDFTADTVRFKEIHRIVAPDFSPGSPQGVVVYDISHRTMNMRSRD